MTMVSRKVIENLAVRTAPQTLPDLEEAISQLTQDISNAAPEDQLAVLRVKARDVFAGQSRQTVMTGVADLATDLDLWGFGNENEVAIYDIIDALSPAPNGAEINFNDGGGDMGHDAAPPRDEVDRTNEKVAKAPLLKTISPKDWEGTPTPEMQWLVHNRIPAGDLTVLHADGGSGKTQTLVELLISVSRNLGDWLGAAVDKAGLCLFLSAEEGEPDIRRRIERVCKHRHIHNPHANGDLQLCFPKLSRSLLVEPDRTGKLIKTELFHSVVQWIETHRPVLVGIDANAAVFGGNNIDRGQVRSFIAILRELGREYGTTIVLLDHPSQRGKDDGTGMAGSVDWNNGPRARIYIKASKTDPDARVLEVMKVNGYRSGETVNLRWNGLTFVTDKVGEAAPQRASAERKVDDLFLRLLAERNAQGRWVTPSKATGYAPKEMAAMPSAEGCTAAALAKAMERLLAAKEIEIENYGYASKPRQRIVITTSNRLPTGE